MEILERGYTAPVYVYHVQMTRGSFVDCIRALHATGQHISAETLCMQLHAIDKEKDMRSWAWQSRPGGVLYRTGLIGQYNADGEMIE